MENLYEDSGKYEALKGGLLSTLPESKKGYMGRLLDNQRAHLMETAPAGVQSASAIGQFQKIMIPMIRRVIPGTIASELVGVQPMQGPTSLAFSLRYVYANAGNTGNSATNITAGDELFGNNSKTLKFYSGGVTTTGTDGIMGTSDDGPLSGTGGLTADMESYGGNEISLQVLRQTVTANTRTLQAKWTLESMQDLKSQHGYEIESELTQGLSAAITQEIDREILDDLVTLAGDVETYDMNSTSFTGVPNYVGDRFAVLGVLINKVCNEIGRKIRVGNGNFVVVSPQVASVLQSASKSVFAPAVQGSFEGPNNTRLIGTLNGTIKVYSYIWYSTGTEPILVGYKGGNGETDAGYFYCPYIPLMAQGPVTDPVTYNQQMRLVTRYGKAIFSSTSSSLGNSADYYGKISIANLSFI